MREEKFEKKLQAIFEVEASEHLEKIRQVLFSLKEASKEEEKRSLEQLFREVHSLKGAARAVQEEELEILCEEFEEELGKVKRGESPWTGKSFQQGEDFVEKLEALLTKEKASSALALSKPHHPIPSSPQTVRIRAENLQGLLQQAEAFLTFPQKMASQAEELEELLQMLRQGVQSLEKRERSWKKNLKESLGQSPLSLNEAKRKLCAEALQLIQSQSEQLHSLKQRVAKSLEVQKRVLKSVEQQIEQFLKAARQSLLLPSSWLLQPLPKICRELAQAQGKEVVLETRGEAIEIDRAVLEALRDPLNHLLRNAIDHGIESKEDRRAKGKPPEGKLTVAIAQRGSQELLLTVEDDGRGIDREVILKRALESSLLEKDPAEEKTPEEIVQLLFTSGFTTKTKGSELSGRGLGLAIVQEAVERLGGKISVSSEVGVGTRFTLECPTSLRTFRAVFVEVEGRRVAVPTYQLKHVLRLTSHSWQSVDGVPSLFFQGSSVPILPLAELLFEEKKRELTPPLYLLLTRTRQKMALAVERVLLEEEIVVKQLGRSLAPLRSLLGVCQEQEKLIPVLHLEGLTSPLRRQRGLS